MATIHSEIEIAVPTTAVFEFLTDPNRIPLVLPSLVENVGIPALPLKVGDSFTYKYQLYGIMLEGKWLVEAYQPSSFYKAQTTGDAVSTWEYSLEDRGGKTFLQLDISYEPPQSVMASAKMAVIEKINKQEAEAFLANTKAALEL